MNVDNFTLNSVYQKYSRKYQTRPVRTAKYQPGMENGWMVYFSNKTQKKNDIPTHEGVKFFSTETDAKKYVEANEKQYMKLDGKLVECEVEYDLLRPVLLRKVAGTENKVGMDFCFGEYTFASNETEDYEFYILEEDSWIILDADGSIRVWDSNYSECCGETFFGNEDDLVYEKVKGKEKYIKVAV